MDTEEVDFGAFESIGADSEGNRDSGYECYQALRFRRADADVPLFAPAGRFERPVLC